MQIDACSRLGLLRGLHDFDSKRHDPTCSDCYSLTKARCVAELFFQRLRRRCVAQEKKLGAARRGLECGSEGMFG